VTPRLLLGLSLALGAAAALNWGFFVQHGAVAAMPPLSLRRPLHSLWLLFSNPRWLTGYAVGIGGWALYIGGLALAPLSLVQATAAGGIGLLALLVDRVGPARLARRERVGVIAAVVGLVLLALSLVGPSGRETRGAAEAIAAWVGGSVLIATLVTRPVDRVVSAGARLGVAAGLFYAAGDVATKAAIPGHDRLAFVPVLLACHGLGFVALQAGFQRGGALSTAGLASLINNVIPIAAGMILFHDPIPGGVLGVLRVMAFASVVAGATLLARPAAGPVPVDAAPARDTR
jgi:hypothetical protein